MKRIIATIALLASPTLTLAGSFATCLLDELPGVQNDHAAGAAYQLCGERYPARYDGVVQGSGRGALSYGSGAECALDKSRDTRSRAAAGMIRVACNRLYDDPAQLTAQESCKSSSPGPWCDYR